MHRLGAQCTDLCLCGRFYSVLITSVIEGGA